MSFLLGSAILVNWSTLNRSEPAKQDIDEDALNDWWTNEHLPERLSIPGFLRVRRYYTTDTDGATSHYLVCYEAESLDILTSKAYMSALNNPTAGTAKFVPLLSERNRCPCHILHSTVRPEFTNQKGGLGGTIARIAFTPPTLPQEREKIRSLVVNHKASTMFKHTVALAVHLLELDDAASKSGSSTKSYEAARFQSRSDTTAAEAGRWIILAEFSELLHAPFSKGPEITKQSVLELEASGAKDISWRIYGMLCAVAA